MQCFSVFHKDKYMWTEETESYRGFHKRPLILLLDVSQEEGRDTATRFSILAAKFSSLSFQLKLLFEAVCLQAQPHESLLS